MNNIKTLTWNVAIALSIMSQASFAELLSVDIGIGTTSSSTGIAIGEDSQANDLSVAIGENSGQNNVGTNSLYIGANVGKNTDGSYNQIAGNSIGNSLLGDVNSIFGSGYDMCLTNVGNPFSSRGCGAQTKVEGNLNSLFGNMTNVTVLGDRNIAFGSNTGSVEGSDNISIGTDAGPGYYLGNLYLSNDFNSSFVTPIKVSNTTSIGNGSSASTASSIAIGNQSKVRGDLESEFGAVGANSVAIGPFSLVEKSSSAVAIGSGSKVLNGSNLSVALGANSIADKENVISVGSATLKREIINVAEGTTSTSAVNLGQVQQMISQSAFNGIPGLVIENNKTSVGMRSAASESNLALGYKATSAGSNSVAIGNDSFTSEDDVDVVSFGNANRDLTRRLTNISDGINSSDAATIGQVRSMFDSFSLNMPVFIPEQTVVQNQIVTDENGNTAVGDGAGIESSGNNNVLLGASSGANSMGDDNVLLGASSGTNSMGDNNVLIGSQSNVIGGSASNSVAIGSGATAGDNAVALGANSQALDNTVSVGSVGNERQIKNVAAGTELTDAANVQQLNSVAQASQSNYQALDRKIDSSINSIKKELREVSKRAYAGTALALAMSNVNQGQTDKVQIQLGLGAFNGESALALSTHIPVNENGTTLSFGGGFTSQGDVGGRVGISFTWDPVWGD